MKTPKYKLIASAFLLGVLLMPMHLFAQLPIMLDSNYVSFYLAEEPDGKTVGGRLDFQFIENVENQDSAIKIDFNKRLKQAAPDAECDFTLTNPSYSGHFAKLYPNDSLVVYNLNLEPICFKLNAIIDSPWVMYENNNTVIKATIINVADSLIFDEVNTVKTIQIVFYDSLGKEKKTETLNRFKFLYGSKAGFIRLAHLGLFPSFNNSGHYQILYGVIRLAGYQNLSGTFVRGKTYFHENEIHDYEVGDEFHEESTLNTQYLGYTKRNIQKCISKEKVNDSLVFTFKTRRHSVTEDRSVLPPIKSDSVDEFEQQVKRPVFTPKPFVKNKHLDLLKSVYTSNVKCGLDAYYWNETNSMWAMNDTCFNMGFTTEATEIERYRGVLGGDVIKTILIGSDTRIKFYKKGSKTCGAPFPQNIGIKENAGIKTVNLYPNPTNNVAVVGMDDVKSLTVFNSLGVAVELPYTVLSNQVELNTTNLTNGVYYVLLQNKQGLARCSLMVQHN